MRAAYARLISHFGAVDNCTARMAGTMNGQRLFDTTQHVEFEIGS